MLKTITMNLPIKVINHFKYEAKEKSVGYQTLIRIALIDHIERNPHQEKHSPITP